MIDFVNEAKSEAKFFEGKILELRRILHADPELGNQEFRTADKIQKFLGELGIESRRILDTAVIADLKFSNPGKCVAFRADIDALPIDEKTGVEFASRNPGVMHACGHDVHMSALLGAALILKKHVNDSGLGGTLRFLFQPNEEVTGGAERMIEAGCLDGVDAVFGAHVSPEIPAGHVAVKYDEFYAAAELFDVEILGKSSHGAEREKGIDAIQATSELVTDILSMNASNAVITVGAFHAGTVRNIIADSAKISGMIRTFGIENREFLRQEIVRKCEAICKKFGTKFDANLSHGYVGVVNDNAMTDFVRNTAEKIFGADNVHVLHKHEYITEDFGYFLLERPGSFYHIGAGCEFPLHSNSFLPTDEAVLTGAALHAGIAAEFLRA